MDGDAVKTDHDSVMIEHRHLQEKVERLDLFINYGPEYKQLDPIEQDRLKRQLEHMRAYNDVLIERIRAFPPVE